ncbi:MAG: hypothetical protein IKX59_03965 [Bacteroidales bacterium]|nr:hypothetical protein [Bacteroidales bacterium]
MNPCKFVILLTFLLVMICTGCTSTRENRAVFSQFVYTEDYCNEESKPDTTVFSSLPLGPEWLFPNGLMPGMRFVDERPESIVHGLSIPCFNMSSIGLQPACYVGRRIRHRQFAVMIEMFFTPTEGDAAGLLISQYFFCRIPTGLALRRINDEGFDVLAETELPDYVTRVYLRVEFNEPTCSFFYRYEGSGPDDWTSVIEDVDLSFLSSSANDSPDALVGLYAEHYMPI